MHEFIFFLVFQLSYLTSLHLLAEADPLMPDSENMRTFITSTSMDASSKALSKELNRTHQRVEDNLSSIGKTVVTQSLSTPSPPGSVTPWLSMWCCFSCSVNLFFCCLIGASFQGMMKEKPAPPLEANRKGLHLTSCLR